MRNRAFLTLALVLALAGANAHAQGTPPGATQGLPFVSQGANQPVLQPLTPGAAPIKNGAAAEAAAATTATPEAGAEPQARKGLPQFDPSTFPRQIFWLAITFAFAYVVFSRKTLPMIGSVLTTRALRIQDDLEQAEKLKKQVEKVRAEYEAAIAQARSEAASIINTLQGDIKKSIEAQDNAFKSRAEQAIEQLEMSINANRARVVGELNGIAANLAVDITSRVAGIKVDEVSARNAIDAMDQKARAA